MSSVGTFHCNDVRLNTFPVFSVQSSKICVQSWLQGNVVQCVLDSSHFLLFTFRWLTGARWYRDSNISETEKCEGETIAQHSHCKIFNWLGIFMVQEISKEESPKPKHIAWIERDTIFPASLVDLYRFFSRGSSDTNYVKISKVILIFRRHVFSISYDLNHVVQTLHSLKRRFSNLFKLYKSYKCIDKFKTINWHSGHHSLDSKGNWQLAHLFGQCGDLEEWEILFQPMWDSWQFQHQVHQDQRAKS